MARNLIIAESIRLNGPADKTGRRWHVTLIEEGRSANKRHYRGSMLERDAHMFDGVVANLDHPGQFDIANRPEGSVMNRAGWYENVRAVRDGGKTRVDADFVCINPSLRTMMKEAWDAGRPDLFQFSINAKATGFARMRDPGDGQVLEDVQGFERVRSVDVVTTAGAGGKVRGLLESGGRDMDEDNKVTLVPGFTEEQSAAIAGLLSAVAESAADKAGASFRAALLEAIEGEDEEDQGEGDEDMDGEGDTVTATTGTPAEAAGLLAESARARGQFARQIAESNKRMAELEAQLYLDRGAALISASLTESKLPAAHAERVRENLTDLLDAGILTAAKVDEVIESERKFVAQLGQANPTGTPAGRVTGGKSGWDEYVADMDAMLTRNSSKGFRSLREAYMRHPSNAGRDYYSINPLEVFNALRVSYDSGITGDVMESVSTATFGNLFADVMHKRMAKLYAEGPYQDWRKFVSDTPSVPDFKAQNWVRWGMYGNVPVVPQGAPYQPLSTPSDEKASLTISKYGGLEDVTLEAIVNDDLGALRRIPPNMVYAVQRTLYESVMDTLTTLGLTTTTSYDGVALYHAGSHGNRAANPLTPAGINASQVAMRGQKPFGAPATEFLGVRNKIRYCIVSPANEAKANFIFNPSAGVTASIAALQKDDGTIARDIDGYSNVDPFAFANKGVEVVVYDKLSAAGNNNHYLTADPAMVDTLAVGFLNGVDTPELFIQDEATRAGAAFSADKITYKVRLFWGVAPIDHRGLYVNELA